MEPSKALSECLVNFVGLLEGEEEAEIIVCVCVCICGGEEREGGRD